MDRENGVRDQQQAILVIDDEPGICLAVQRILEAEGCRVDVAHDGRTGLARVRSRPPALALIDVKIPDINGLELINLIHQVDPEIICIVITGYATVEMAVKAIKEGAYDFLTKPFSADALVLAVNQGLERRMLVQEARRAARAEEQAQKLGEEKSRLEELNQAKAQFIRLVSHELQAPVSAVENYLKLLLEGYVPPERESEILRKCISRTEEERMLIADLLELGKLEVLESPKTGPVNLSEILQQVLNDCQEVIERKQLELCVEVAENIPAIQAAPEQIRSLWENLVGNAIKYTPEFGKVSIFLGSTAQEVTSRVTDSGIGIPAEDQGNLFSEFFRAKNARAAGLPGTGLGLAIVKKILDSLGGTITVSSQPDHGASFQFSIPLPAN
jgi:signal transduction histidine kinase